MKTVDRLIDLLRSSGYPHLTLPLLSFLFTLEKLFPHQPAYLLYLRLKCALLLYNTVPCTFLRAHENSTSILYSTVRYLYITTVQCCCSVCQLLHINHFIRTVLTVLYIEPARYARSSHSSMPRKCTRKPSSNSGWMTKIEPSTCTVWCLYLSIVF